MSITTTQQLLAKIYKCSPDAGAMGSGSFGRVTCPACLHSDRVGVGPSHAWTAIVCRGCGAELYRRAEYPKEALK